MLSMFAAHTAGDAGLVRNTSARIKISLSKILDLNPFPISTLSVSASFGFSVAISGERLVVGSHLQSSLAWVSGAAYVFVHNGTSWFEQAFIKASNPDSQDYFGRAVAVSGNTVLVGAAEDDSNATGINGDQFDNSAENSGAAYVFQAKALSIAKQPIAGVSGGVLLTQPVIVIRDWTGQISTSEIPPVTVAIRSGEGGTLGGGRQRLTLSME